MVMTLPSSAVPGAPDRPRRGRDTGLSKDTLKVWSGATVSPSPAGRDVTPGVARWRAEHRHA